MPDEPKSCGRCKWFRDVGYKDWGECHVPLPVLPPWMRREHCGAVYHIGGPMDYGPDCELYEPIAANAAGE